MKNKLKTLKKNEIKAKIANGIWKFRKKFWNNSIKIYSGNGTLIVTSSLRFKARLRPRPHVSEYFWIRKFSFAQTVLNIYGRELGSILWRQWKRRYVWWSRARTVLIGLTFLSCYIPTLAVVTLQTFTLVKPIYLGQIHRKIQGKFISGFVLPR